MQRYATACATCGDCGGHSGKRQSSEGISDEVILAEDTTMSLNI